MDKFWNFIRDESDSGEDAPRSLFLTGEISETSWFGDEVTPKLFRDELESGSGDITVWINSPGGDVFAASQIYNMLREYKGNVHVVIDSLAASAASVIAMAGDTVSISPVGMLMIHDPMMMAAGNAKELEKAIDILSEVKESIINAYMFKSGMSHKKIAELMSNETWMNARKALEFGLVDEILFENKEPEKYPEEDSEEKNEEEKPKETTKTATAKVTPHVLRDVLYSQKAIEDSFLSKVTDVKGEGKTPIAELEKRLNLLIH